MAVSRAEGSIVRIKLENILTYDSVEFTTGAHLNVIIGPNGTGKSTIVCAICLGLAGKTAWLGRAQQFSEFIKHGKNKGRIELELYNNDGDNWKITREINRDNTSKWSVNNRPSTQKAVEELVSRLNIQVGNLTQFLPQEKVADFAKMSPSELLENTEKAVGGAVMYDNHQKLKEARSGARKLEQDYRNIGDRLEQEKQKNSRIEQDVKNFEERQKNLCKIKTLQMKKSWTEYEEKRRLFTASKEEKDQMEAALKQARSKYAPLQKKLEAAKRQRDVANEEIKTKTAALKEVAKKAQANGKEVDNLTDKFVEIQDELKFKKDQEEARKKQVRDLQRQLDALKNDLANAEESVDVQPQLDIVNKRMREISHEMNRINHQGEEIRIAVENHRRNVNSIERELRTLRSIENQRLEMLRGKHRHTYDAVMWLRQNKHRFTGTIHEPVMLSVNMKNRQMAKYLENHVSFNDMRAFICENSADFNLFMDIMREEQNLRVNAVKTPRGSLDQFRPKFDISKYKKYGFHSYMKDLFQCPEAVMKFLCAQYKVFQIPVGDNRTRDMVDQITQEAPELRCFYTASNSYNIKKSKYDGSTSTRSTRLRDASLLTVSMDSNRERELMQQLEGEQFGMRTKEEEYHTLQQQSQQLESELNGLRDEKKQIMSKKDVRKRLQLQIESKTKRISDEEAQAINIRVEEQKTMGKVKDINVKKYKHLMEYLHNTQKCAEWSMMKVRLTIRHSETEREFNTVDQEIREQTQSLQQAEAEFERKKVKMRDAKEVAKKFLDVAKKSTNTGPNEDLDPEYKKIFAELPTSLEEIDAKIHEHQVRAECTVQTDQRVVEDYRKRKREIVRLEEELAGKEEEMSRHQTLIEDAKKEWLDPLQELIGRINRSFGHFFNAIKCVGEVGLNVPENPEEYSKYGIGIKVKFRDAEPLRELNQHHQSGGERSVSTVLYMMALQELAKCPFRCVDEINQGMDPVNERKVFELVVQTVCRKSTSQYFLLTPKLLPDLEYTDNMTVLCVYNGPNSLNHTDWKLKRFLRKRKNLKDE